MVWCWENRPGSYTSLWPWWSESFLGPCQKPLLKGCTLLVDLVPGIGGPQVYSLAFLVSSKSLQQAHLSPLLVYLSSSQRLGLAPGPDISLSSFFVFQMAFVPAIKKGAPWGLFSLPLFLHSSSYQLYLLFWAGYYSLANVTGLWMLPSSSPGRVSLHRTFSWSDTTRGRRT